MAGPRTINSPEEYWQFIGSKHPEALVAARLGLGKEWEDFVRKNWRDLGMHEYRKSSFEQFLTRYGRDPNKAKEVEKTMYAENLKKEMAAQSQSPNMPPAWS